MSLKEILEFMEGRTPDIIEIMDSKRLAAAENYTAEDVLSEAVSGATAFQFKGVSKIPDGTGEIVKAIVFCSETALTPRITLYLFSKTPTTNLLDNVANAAPSLGDSPVYQGRIDFPAMEDLGGGSAAMSTPSTYGNLPLPYKTTDGSLYGIAVLRDAVTGEAAGMTLLIKLQVRRD